MTDETVLRTPTSQPLTPVCSIGASAGGVEALRTFFRQVPNDLDLAYVVIVHLAPDQPSALSQILGDCTDMPVHEVADSPILKPNCVYVIPPNQQLVIEGDHVTLRSFDEPRGQRAPIDVFFRSIAAGRGDGLAVILSGAGSDGSNGIRAIKEGGGVVFVQEPSEAQFSSMPQQAIATGVADFVAPIVQLVDRISEVARSKEAVRSLDMDGAANELRRIITFLRTRTGHDFSSYKRATVMRRVLRRLQVSRILTLADYADHLRETPEEAQELFSDLLISVTMFFRDPRAFEELRRRAIAPLFDELDETGIRAWVVGCATGEEAYSLVMLIREEAEQRKIDVPIQVFASDLDEGALATAREGRYPRSIEADVSEERLTRFFVDEGTHYRVRKEVRDAVLFASHSVLRDPPFTRLDLVCCRNLLIYLERLLQGQVCAIFHYGLKPNRYLFLGSAETIDANADQFYIVDREARIYRSRPQPAIAIPIVPQAPVLARHYPLTPWPLPRGEQRSSSPAETHAAALEQAAPPSILVDEAQNIIHLSPTAGRFILHSAGPFTQRLAAVVRPELRLDLKLALDRAFEERLPTLTHPVIVDLDGARRRVALSVSPILSNESAPTQAIVFFNDGGPIAIDELQEFEAPTKPDQLRRLYAELKGTQEALLSSRGEHEASIQDLRAANEELQSINEEYRSTSEELETSKEELQSINEELQTVNAELKRKLEDISIAHNDLQNLTAATEIGTLFLDSSLRIKMFTPPVADLFNITTADIGRAITDFTHRLIYDGIEDSVHAILRDVAPQETEVQAKDGRWFMLRLRPYRTIENNINGTVLTFVDISARLEAERRLAESERRLRALVQASAQVTYRMSPDWKEMHELSGGEFLADTDRLEPHWLQRYILEEDRTDVQAAIDEAIRSRTLFEKEHRVRKADGTIGWTLSRAVPIIDNGGAIIEWFGAASDETKRHEAAETLQESEAQLQVMVAELHHRTRNLLGIVGTIMRQLAGSSSSLADFRARFNERLEALSRVQSLLSRRGETGIDLCELVRLELDALGVDPKDSRISVTGASTLLPRTTAQTLSMAIHELATNARKYGALNGASGRLAVQWTVGQVEGGKRSLQFVWIETGILVPIDEADGSMRQGGYGRELIERALPYTLKATTTYELGRDRLDCTVVVPLP